VLHKNTVYVDGAREDCYVEVALQYNDTYTEKHFFFANSINTTEGAPFDRLPVCLDAGIQ